MAWPRVKLATLLREPLRNGHSASASADGTGIRTLTLTAVTVGDFSEANSKMTVADPAKVADLWVQPGDIYVQRSNTPDLVGTARLYRGPANFAIFPDLLIRVRLREAVLPAYVEAFLHSNEARLYFKKAAQGIAGSMPKISQGTIESLLVPLPGLQEQERVVQELDKQLSRLDTTEARLNRALVNLKRARASVLKAAVEGRLVPTEAELARATGSAFEGAVTLLTGFEQDHRAMWRNGGRKGVYVPLAGPDLTGHHDVPEGWVWASAEQACTSVESGTTPPKEKFVGADGVPFIKVYHLQFDGTLDFFDNRPTYVDSTYHQTQMRRSKTRPGCVLTNIVGPPLGKVSVVPSSHSEWNINQAVACFLPRRGLLNTFLAVYLQSDVAQRWLLATAKTTTSQVNLAITTCRRLPIPLPPLAEQHRIVAEVDRRLSVLDRLEARITANLSRCKRLRQAILKRAFEGRLVPQDPT